MLGEALVLLGDQLLRALVNGGELLAGRKAIWAQRARRAFLQLLDAGHSDFEKLIEITRGDTKKTQPFEQRHRRVLRLCQHTLVELEQRELAIDQSGRGRGCHGR